MYTICLEYIQGVVDWGIVQGTFGQRTYGSTEIRPSDIGCNRYTKFCISDDTLFRSTAKHLREQYLTQYLI